MARTFTKQLRYESDERPLIPHVPRKPSRKIRVERTPEEKVKSRLELRQALTAVLHSDLPEKSFALLLSVGTVWYAYLAYSTGSLAHMAESMPRLLNSAAILIGDFLF